MKKMLLLVLAACLGVVPVFAAVATVPTYQEYYAQDFRLWANTTPYNYSTIQNAPGVMPNEWICPIGTADRCPWLGVHPTSHSEHWTMDFYQPPLPGFTMEYRWNYSLSNVAGRRLSYYMYPGANWYSYSYWNSPKLQFIYYVYWHNQAIAVNVKVNSTTWVTATGDGCDGCTQSTYQWNGGKYMIEVNSSNNGIMIATNKKNSADYFVLYPEGNYTFNSSSDFHMYGPFDGFNSSDMFEAYGQSCCGSWSNRYMDEIVVEDILSQVDCYQESANVSPGCGGGQGTGRYAGYPNLSMYAKAIDGQWSVNQVMSNDTWQSEINATRQSDPCGGEYLLVNYTKPRYAVSGYWVLSDGLSLSVFNATHVSATPRLGSTEARFSRECWNAENDKVQLRIMTYPACFGPLTEQFAQCWNGTSWEGMITTQGWASTVTDFYVNYSMNITDSWLWEEGVRWRVCPANWTCVQWGVCQPNNQQVCAAYNDTEGCGLAHDDDVDGVLNQSCSYTFSSEEGEGTGIVKSSSYIQEELYAPKSITTQFLSGEGTSSIVSASGVYNYNGKVMSFPNATDESAVLAVDTYGKSYTVFASVSQVLYLSIVSLPPVNNIMTAANLSVQALRCAYDSVNNALIATAVGVSAPKKDQVMFQASYEVLQTGRKGGDVGSSSMERVLSTPETGTYRVTLTTKDLYTPAQVQNTCEIDVIIPETAALPAQQCAIGINNIDGNFNYPDELTNHGWVMGIGSEVSTIDSNYAVFSAKDGQTSSIYHPLACDERWIRVETRMRPPQTNDDLGVMRIQLMARSTVKTNSVIMPIAMVTITKTDQPPYLTVTAEGSTNQTDIYYSNSSTNVTWLRIGVMADRQTKKMTIDVTPENPDGSLQVGKSVEVPLTNDLPGQFAGVMLFGINALYVDYVKVMNQSNVIIPLMTPFDLAKRVTARKYLTFCSRERDAYIAENYDPKVRISYEHVDGYCKVISAFAEHINNPGYCTYKDLQEVVMANSKCYLEAYEYCVNVTYPRSAGVMDDTVAKFLRVDTEVKPLEGVSTGADGATVCATALGISVAAKKQAIPFMNVVWGLFTQYWIIVLIIVAIIVLVGKMGPKR